MHCCSLSQFVILYMRICEYREYREKFLFFHFYRFQFVQALERSCFIFLFHFKKVSVSTQIQVLFYCYVTNVFFSFFAFQSFPLCFFSSDFFFLPQKNKKKKSMIASLIKTSGYFVFDLPLKQRKFNQIRSFYSFVSHRNIKCRQVL